MLLSARESARVLANAGIARHQARVLLAAGLAGPGATTSGAPLYDHDAVRALAARPLVDLRELTALCPPGLYIARLTRSTRVDFSAGWDRLAEQLRCQPVMTPMSAALLAARLTAYGGLPWVATLCGHVVLGADATRVDATAGDTRFTLRPPGASFAAVADSVLRTLAGGRPWVLRLPRG